ncbi:MAG: hypothetical protein ACE5JP_09155 [Candidatus Bipolaricaulia bacterium]
MVKVYRPSNTEGHTTKLMTKEKLEGSFQEQVETLFKRTASGYQRAGIDEVEAEDEVLILRQIQGG